MSIASSMYAWDIDRLAGSEVASALLHLQRVQPLVGRAPARAEREQALCLQLRRLHRSRQRAVVRLFDPRNAILQVIGEPRFRRAAVPLAEHTAPEPLPEPLLRSIRRRVVVQPAEDGAKRHQLRRVRQVLMVEDPIIVKEGYRAY